MGLEARPCVDVRKLLETVVRLGLAEVCSGQGFPKGPERMYLEMTEIGGFHPALMLPCVH